MGEGNNRQIISEFAVSNGDSSARETVRKFASQIDKPFADTIMTIAQRIDELVQQNKLCCCRRGSLRNKG